MQASCLWLCLYQQQQRCWCGKQCSLNKKTVRGSSCKAAKGSSSLLIWKFGTNFRENEKFKICSNFQKLRAQGNNRWRCCCVASSTSPALAFQPHASLFWRHKSQWPLTSITGSSQHPNPPRVPLCLRHSIAGHPKKTTSPTTSCLASLISKLALWTH